MQPVHAAFSCRLPAFFRSWDQQSSHDRLAATAKAIIFLARQSNDGDD
jgi:hypothetical protein